MLPTVRALIRRQSLSKPLRLSGEIMLETAAVYWESTVRIYGITEKVGLSMLTIFFPSARMEYWGSRIQEMADEHDGFEMVFFQEVDKNNLKLCIVCEENAQCSLRGPIEKAIKNEAGISFHIDFPVELISFHGPHFQDRYGIAHGVFDALERGKFPLLAAGCAGTSVYVVFPEKMARPAARLLAENFIVPQAEER
jgi:aspartokinase